MAGSAPQSEPEVLEQGHGRRPAGRHRRQRLVVLAVVVVLVAGPGSVLEHRSRARASAAVAACTRDAVGAVEFANRRVDAITDYVRPALEAGPGVGVRRGLLGLISSTVRPTVPGVQRARRRCASVALTPLHAGLRRTRRDCLQLLDEDLAYLGAVVAHGVRALGSRSLPPGRCSAA